MNLTGIILAGGKSSRMGTDKGLLDYHGKKLVEYPLDLLANYCNQLLISSNSDEYLNFGVEVVKDEWKNCGPVGGLVSSLKKSLNEWNLVLGCDLPFVNDSLIQLLVNSPIKGLGVVPIHDQLKEPLVALYHRSVYTHFENAILQGNYALHKILNNMDMKYINIAPLLIEFPNLLTNFNSPGDLSK